MRFSPAKVFKDPVHGYIEVPTIIAKRIIDTEQFQRLKFIEQTSMRALFPAARHDRFVHSLGTYWLGIKAFEGFRNNSKNVFKELEKIAFVNCNELASLDDKWWDKYELLFMIACLMHDCAHAPFSHTLEDYYALPTIKIKDDNYTRLSWLLRNRCLELGDSSFHDDFYKETIGTLSGIGKPHEQMSAYIVLNYYKDTIKEIIDSLLEGNRIIDADVVFICRAIIGCKYKMESLENSIKNCIISLLNSDLIDVDGLDYIVRDSQMSGMSAYDIDYQRLLNSFMILPVYVYENIDYDHQSIDGLWLKGSVFSSTNSEKCTVDTAVSLNTKSNIYKDRLEDFQPHISPNEYDFKPTLEKSIARIHGVPEFEMALIDSGRLSKSCFTGCVVKGKKIIENLDSNAENQPISFVLAYDKRCLSIIQNTINARNDEYLWIYSHPKVMYCANYLQCELLKLSAKYICCKCNGKCDGKDELSFDCDGCDCHSKLSHEHLITHILGYDFLLGCPDDRLITNKLHENGYYFYRTNDDDLNALFKRIKLENDALGRKKSQRIEQVSNEYFSRNHKSVMWKSFAEYKAIFMMLDDSSWQRNLEVLFEEYKDKTDGKSEKYIYLSPEDQNIFNKLGFKDVLIIFGRANTKAIQVSEFFVKYEDRVEQLSKLFTSNMIKENANLGLKFVFTNTDKKMNHQIIKELNDSLGERTSVAQIP